MSGYDVQTWVDGIDGETPLSADRLNHMEEGIAGAYPAAGAAWAATTHYPLGYIATYVGQRWQCVVDHTSTTTFDFAKWVKLGSNAQVGRGYLVPADALANFVAAMKNHATQRIEVSMFGDSTSYGSSSESQYSWYQQRLKSLLLAAGFTDGGHGYHNINDDATYPASTDDGTYPKVSSKTGFTAGANVVPGYASNVTSDVMSMQWRGTAIRLYFESNSTGGKIGYSIDGGAETILDTLLSINAPTVPYNSIPAFVGGLAEGVHTVTVTNHGPSAVPGLTLTSTGGIGAGGSLTVGQTYYYWVTVTSASGESTPIALGGFTPPNTANRTYGGLQFRADYGQTGWKLYRSTTANDPTTSQLLRTGTGIVTGNTVNIFDDGSFTPTAGTPPTTSTLGNMTSSLVAWLPEFLRAAGLVMHKDAVSGAVITTWFDTVNNPAALRGFTPRRLGLKTETETNTSVSGEFWRIAKVSNDLYRNVKLAIFQIGTNDIGSGSPTTDNQYLTNLNNYTENLALGIRAARAAGADVILISPPYNSAVDIGAAHYQGRFKAAMLHLALSHGVAYVDFQEALGWGFGTPASPHLDHASYNKEADFLWANVLQPALTAA